MLDEERLAAQEACFARAFAARDLEIARTLYHPDVVYLSPTVRLYGWPHRIEGVERTLEFIAAGALLRSERTPRGAAQAVGSSGAPLR